MTTGTLQTSTTIPRRGNGVGAHDRGQLEFGEYDGTLVATVNEERQFDVRSYGRSLPTRMRPEPRGREIEINHVDDFIDWSGEDPVGIRPEEDALTPGEKVDSRWRDLRPAIEDDDAF